MYAERITLKPVLTVFNRKRLSLTSAATPSFEKTGMRCVYP